MTDTRSRRLRKVLIANRGEIAVRIAQAAAEHGLTSVAVYADADADALHVAVADEAWALPGDTVAETYLSIPALLDVARRSGADAVHPGYGFLSESAAFARAVVAAGLTWIGPAPETIEALGDKVTARGIAARVGAPLVAGTDGPVRSAEDAVAFAREHGVPIVIKAAHGGGGRGMRIVHRIEDVAEQYASAVREATLAFGRGECFAEQYLERPRHVEVQVLGDGRGRVVVVGTRDCSTQRRHQKLVEEAPAPALTPQQDQRIRQGAHDICAAVSYAGAGTVEFLVGASGAVSFLEVNTRLQVEHPVTEVTTGVDLVIEQFRIAEGRGPSIDAPPAPRGHALEFRINAEDPGRGFLPSPGRIDVFDAPGGPGIRIDAGVRAGSPVPAAFDSLVAKLVVWAPTRAAAIERARVALARFRIDGVPTLLPFHRRLVDEPRFRDADGGGMHTRWVEEECAWLDGLAAPRSDAPGAAIASSWIEIDGRRHALRLPAALLAGARVVAGEETTAASPEERAEARAEARAVVRAVVRAEGGGTLRTWAVDDGAEVSDGEPVAVVEAMKMETTIPASASGVLRRRVEPGAQLRAGEVIADIVPR
ncbi:acetyl/propionyl/methylcrotonyl-CoA carboxylase subunit alpha [Microbacterium sp. No. 7]|uniref:acetyl/propionyl/methylcrotonyl-CoA carboxylase subunit alpha n=1 Tax=Microbacterium sp. No. 7 TaxID=1714373 RepID=UPI0006D18370|nr:biotin carboxylase N-terminal domain-containing protein [Microbacterium sp. No. 7]ALJ20770.1 acetyl/propionyl-CoA carboxylase subuit alpha [Microbacterium sp. No. 7]